MTEQVVEFHIHVSIYFNDIKKDMCNNYVSKCVYKVNNLILVQEAYMV
jgi:hypothetical protein